MNTMQFTPWPDIVLFHNVRKSCHKFPEELLKGNVIVSYKSKIKLHGSNCAVHINKNGEWIAQSRTQIISPTNDNFGFARWAEENKQYWIEISKQIPENLDEIIIFGEWCGKGINSNAAITELEQKIFAIFAIQIDKDKLIIEPNEIQKYLPKIKNDRIYILPWFKEEVIIDYLNSAEELEKLINKINETIIEIDKCDPWVKEIFNKEGNGEGLVFYPISHQGKENFGNLAFKAKGDKHKATMTKASIQIDTEIVKSVDAFVKLFLTNSRLEQGVRFTNNGELEFSMKNMGSFIKWINDDIKKESKDELEVAKLKWEQVAKSLSDSARKYYLENSKKL